MNKNFLNFGKAVVLAATLTFVSCGKEEGGTVEPPTTVETTFNMMYRVAGTGALADWSIQPCNEAQLKQGSITFNGKGHNLPNERTHEMYSTNNGKTVYVFSSMTRLVTKYEVTGDARLYREVDKIDVTPIIGNAFGNWKVLDEKNAIVYVVSPAHQRAQDGSYVKTVSTLKIGRIDLETFTANLKDVKSITLADEPANSEIPNIYIAGVEHPVLHNGKLYFGVRKIGYDPTQPGRAANIAKEDAFYTTTLTLDFPSLANPATFSSTVGKGSSTYPSVFYGPSYLKTETNDIYHITPMKGGIYKIVNGQYDNSYEINLKTALGESSDIYVSGIYYTESNVAYVAYAPAAKVMQGGLIYQDGKAVWSIARVDLKAKTAIKMNVTENLWLTFHQSAKFVNGKLYMALCPMTGNGNVYIFDPTKADANGFEKGATLESAGGAIYLGIF